MGRLQLVVVCVALAACGGDDVQDGCLGGTYDVTSEGGNGPYAIAGIIAMPMGMTLQPASGLRLDIQTGTAPVRSAPFAHVSTPTTMVTYHAGDLTDGSWSICLNVDVDGNGKVYDIGIDWTGCYDGTTNGFGWVPIALDGMCRSGKDFAVHYYRPAVTGD